MCLRNLKLESFRELSLERLKALLYSEKDFPVQLTKPVRGLKQESFFSGSGFGLVNQFFLKGFFRIMIR